MTETGSVALSVTGMICGSCRARVRNALADVAGVRSVEVDLERGEATVLLGAPASPSTASLVAAVEAVGFRAAPGEAPAGGLPVLGSRGGSCCSR